MITIILSSLIYRSADGHSQKVLKKSVFSGYDQEGFMASLRIRGKLNCAKKRKEKSMVAEPIRLWEEKDDVIYFNITSDGTTGKEWIERLESKGFRINRFAKNMLHSLDFKPTNGVTTKVAVLKGMLFESNKRVTWRIRAEADKRNLTKPNAEITCLICEKFTNEEIEAMGLRWIVVMHEPIKDIDSIPYLLCVVRFDDDDDRWIGAYYDCPGYEGDREDGFAFSVSQVES